MGLVSPVNGAGRRSIKKNEEEIKFGEENRPLGGNLKERERSELEVMPRGNRGSTSVLRRFRRRVKRGGDNSEFLKGFMKEKKERQSHVHRV